MQHEQEHPDGRQGWAIASILGVIALLFGIVSLLGGGMMGWGMMGPGMITVTASIPGGASSCWCSGHWSSSA